MGLFGFCSIEVTLLRTIYQLKARNLISSLRPPSPVQCALTTELDHFCVCFHF